jgi:protein unc-50
LESWGSPKDLQTIRQKVGLLMTLAVFVICVLVVVLVIGFVEYMAKKVRNQDDDDDWGGHCQY